jgi:transposase
MEKTDFRSLPAEERNAIRKTAVRLVIKGEKQNKVAALFGVRLGTVCDWVKKYKGCGFSSLKDQSRGARSEDRKLLTAKQEKQIQEMITDKMPDQLKLDFALWTRKAVMELVDREFGIKLGLTTMGDYLREWGFTPQKPKKRAYEQCPKSVERWLKEEYPIIKEKAKSEGAEIQWGDETGIKNCCNHGRSYAPKGKTPVKKSMSKRFSVNMVSTVTNQGKVQFMIYSGTMNSGRFIEFLEQLIKGAPKKIYLILDNLRVHHSKPVKEWLEKDEIKDKIELFFLPSYSPERNPDEYLNCDLKHGISNKKSPKNQNKLEEGIKNHMLMLQLCPERVMKYFKHESISYAA